MNADPWLHSAIEEGFPHTRAAMCRRFLGVMRDIQARMIERHMPSMSHDDRARAESTLARLRAHRDHELI